MNRNADFLLQHVIGALKMVSVGGEYSAVDDSQLWAVSTQKVDDKLTGRVALACADAEALADLRQELEHMECTVEEGRSVNDPSRVVPNTLIITLPVK